MKYKLPILLVGNYSVDTAVLNIFLNKKFQHVTLQLANNKNIYERLSQIELSNFDKVFIVGLINEKINHPNIIEVINTYHKYSKNNQVFVDNPFFEIVKTYANKEDKDYSEMLQIITSKTDEKFYLKYFALKTILFSTDFKYFCNRFDNLEFHLTNKEKQLVHDERDRINSKFLKDEIFEINQNTVLLRLKNDDYFNKLDFIVTQYLKDEKIIIVVNEDENFSYVVNKNKNLNIGELLFNKTIGTGSKELGFFNFKDGWQLKDYIAILLQEV